MTFLFFIMGLFALQVHNDFPDITEVDIPGIEIEESKTFNGNALWGYINGGADIYLEYGFDKLLAQKVNYKGKLYVVDVYKMTGPESAFGIFSVSHMNCENKLSENEYSCVTPYQVQLVKGPFYISIVNENGSNAEQLICKKIANILGNKINDKSYSLPALFDKDELIPYEGKVKLLNGRLGVENGFPMWASLFEGIEGFNVVIMPIEFNDSKINIAIIDFADDNFLMTFAQNLDRDSQIMENSSVLIKENQLYLKTLKDNKLIFMESEGDLTLIDKYIEILNLE